MSAILFYVFAGIAVGFSLLVVLLRNPVTSALSLVVSFFAASGLFVLLQAPFLGIIQVLIYAGAILVLFLFVVMMLNVRSRELQLKSHRLIGAGGMLMLALFLALFFWFVDLPTFEAPEVASTFGSIESVGEVLLGPYALVFELVSLVLLAGMIGVVVLSTEQNRKKL